MSTLELSGRMLNEICYLDGKPLLEYVLPAVIRELKKNQVKKQIQINNQLTDQFDES